MLVFKLNLWKFSNAISKKIVNIGKKVRIGFGHISIIYYKSLFGQDIGFVDLIFEFLLT